MAESKQTWYLPIGSAVHDMVQDYIEDPSKAILTEDYLYPYIRRQRLIEPDTSKWLAGGPKAAPVVGEKAVAKARECFERAVEFLDDIDVWEVEYDASGSLPGLSVPIVAYIDIVGEHKKKGPVIWDWKTGSTKPDNFQLETYAALLRQGVYPQRFKGKYVMLAWEGKDTRYIDLSEIDPAAVGAKYQDVVDRMGRKLYPANAGFGCGFCFNQDNCLLNAGKTTRAIYYDRSEDDGIPF